MKNFLAGFLLTFIFAFLACNNEGNKQELSKVKAYAEVNFCDMDQDKDGFTPSTGDCNDQNAELNPDAKEACDGIDNDCDLQIDEDFDQDGDGFTTCAAPTPDCDDTNATIYPGATEVCDNVDNNCDSKIDEGFDKDGDGFSICAAPTPDCDDTNEKINPAAQEICNNLDDNCSGEIDENLTQSCSTICSQGTETCLAGEWKNCTAKQPILCTDYVTCEKNQPVCLTSCPPAPEEICDDKDNNCDDKIDEVFPNKNQTCEVGIGECKNTGTYICKTDHTGTECSAKAGTPTLEICDKKDNDCNGLTDEGFDSDGDGYAVCVECNDEDKNIHPGATELCDSADNNCDGKIDEGCENEDQDEDGFTVAAGDCDDADALVHPFAIEIGNNQDDDCDKEIDEKGAGIEEPEEPLTVSFENGVVVLSGSGVSEWIGAYFWTAPGAQDENKNFYEIKYAKGKITAGETMAFIPPAPAVYVYLNFGSINGTVMYLDPDSPKLILGPNVTYHLDLSCDCYSLKITK